MRYWEKIKSRYRRLSVEFLATRYHQMTCTIPFISFTFDDFPKSAYTIGGNILKNFGLKGTYYISLGMMNQMSDTGEIADIATLTDVLSDGHELGCHTYSHVDPWESKSDIFEYSIIENQRSFSKYFPENTFKTFAYPYGKSTPKTKHITSKYFLCCRGGKQSFNAGKIDLNYLNAFFIDNRKKQNLASIKDIISRNSEEKGWLIFVTHGVDDNPSPYGCAPDFFEKIVRYSIDSGAVILPVINTIENMINDDRLTLKE